MSRNQKKQKMKPKVSRRKKKTKTKTGINEKKSKITIENSKEIKSWFFKRRDITTDSTQIQSIIGDYNEQLYSME